MERSTAIEALVVAWFDRGGRGAIRWLPVAVHVSPSDATRMLICMQSTSVRIDVSTHDELKRLAAELHTTVGNTVSLAVRALRQDRIGDELTARCGMTRPPGSMPTSGDVVDLDLGRPRVGRPGSATPPFGDGPAGPRRRRLGRHVVPLTRTIRRFHSEIVIEPDAANGWSRPPRRNANTFELCLRAGSLATRGNVGPPVLAQLRETIAVILDLHG